MELKLEDMAVSPGASFGLSVSLCHAAFNTNEYECGPGRCSMGDGRWRAEGLAEC